MSKIKGTSSAPLRERFARTNSFPSSRRVSGGTLVAQRDPEGWITGYSHEAGEWGNPISPFLFQTDRVRGYHSIPIRRNTPIVAPTIVIAAIAALRRRPGGMGGDPAMA